MEKPLNASLIAPLVESGLVTPVAATSAIAIIDTAPIGKALPIIAAIVPTNSANKCQALGSTPWGTGITNQMIRVIATAIKVGIGRNGVNLFIRLFH